MYTVYKENVQLSLSTSWTDKGAVEVYLHLSLTSSLDGYFVNFNVPAALPPGNKNGTHWMRGFVGATAGMDVITVLPLLASEPRIVHPVAYTLY